MSLLCAIHVLLAIMQAELRALHVPSVQVELTLMLEQLDASSVLLVIVLLVDCLVRAAQQEGTALLEVLARIVQLELMLLTRQVLLARIVLVERTLRLEVRLVRAVQQDTTARVEAPRVQPVKLASTRLNLDSPHVGAVQLELIQTQEAHPAPIAQQEVMVLTQAVDIATVAPLVTTRPTQEVCLVPLVD
jgi:hypothetical protein